MGIFRRTRELHFVYAEKFRDTGSTVMRGLQLSEIARRSLDDRMHVHFSPLTRPFRNATLFLTKGALKEASAQVLTTLKAGGNRLLFDVVDEVPPPTTTGFADVLISASVTAYTDHLRDYPGIDIALVNHHVDPRVQALGGTRPTDRLRAGYFGELLNAVLTPAIEERVDATLVDTSRQDAGWLRSLGDYNLHYAVRNFQGADYHKPFLKGFTAAHCQANILIQRSQAEALHWLGDDYPFLLEDDPGEGEILAALDDLSASFGGPEWHEGLARMADVRARTSPARIGAELRRAIA